MWGLSALAWALIGAWVSVVVSCALGAWAVALTMMARREMAAAEKRAEDRFERLMAGTERGLQALGEAISGAMTDPEWVESVADGVFKATKARLDGSAGGTGEMQDELAGLDPRTRSALRLLERFGGGRDSERSQNGVNAAVPPTHWGNR